MAAAPLSKAIAVYCGSSLGKQQAHANAALSVGRALAAQNRPLVYGGGQQGLMGIVSNAVLQNGGEVTGVIPFAMHAAGGEQDKTSKDQPAKADVENSDPGKMQTIIVDSMHERKVEMASRSVGFIGLPGGFGTFEEIFEVTTWTQLGIHSKPVVLLNVLSFFNPLRQLIENGTKEGYINPANQRLIVFVDGPSSHDEHEKFDWGTAALEAIETWKGDDTKSRFNWRQKKDGSSSVSLESV
ncbi:hypothetical protein D9615_001624 [Tricholomella constricta]|uniref:Cytokinin riboside 5'-monophosphate phosphoribohydrolase n=1 Tax=Tricholomella constricta TaxID=117010 RepID=A0A8H5MAT8_9AGAR|nr:hypothetical protein D9615_001624 [Tricholomella constricta]